MVVNPDGIAADAGEVDDEDIKDAGGKIMLFD